MVNTISELMMRAINAATRPASSFGIVRDALEGLGEIIWAGLNPAPQTPLNVEIGPHRRFTVVRQQLSDYKEVQGTRQATKVTVKRDCKLYVEGETTETQLADDLDASTFAKP